MKYIKYILIILTTWAIFLPGIAEAHHKKHHHHRIHHHLKSKVIHKPTNIEVHKAATTPSTTSSATLPEEAPMTEAEMAEWLAAPIEEETEQECLENGWGEEVCSFVQISDTNKE